MGGVEVQKGGRRGKEREEEEDEEKEMGGEEAAMAVTQEKSEACISFPFSFEPETK